MKVKLGKVSIGCFVASVLMYAVCLYEAWGSIKMNEDCPVCQGPCMDRMWDSFSDAVGTFLVLFVPLVLLGVTLAFFGTMKSEFPKIYWKLGLILNGTWVLLGIFLFIIFRLFRGV